MKAEEAKFPLILLLCDIKLQVQVFGFMKQNYFLQTDATSVSCTAGDQRKLMQPRLSSRDSLEPSVSTDNWMLLN